MTQENSIKYEKSFVAFLDVLGFKQMVSSKDNKLIETYFGIVNRAIYYLKSVPSKKEIGSIVISDSIILTIPCADNKVDNVEKLRHLCIAIGLIQQSLAIAGIWLRGAITCGDTYFNQRENQIVGPAYVNAYILEESLAVFPRVFLDVKLIPDLEFKNITSFIESINKTKSGRLGYSNWGKRILFEWLQPNGEKVKDIPQDLPLFIDYLSPFVEDRNNKHLRKIFTNIQKNMHLDSRIYSKHRWTVDYLKALAIRAEQEGYELNEQLECLLNSL